jgi:ankyrin repeat protein
VSEGAQRAMVSNHALLLRLNFRLYCLCGGERFATAPSAAAVQSLINEGADVNTKNYGFSALMNATMWGHLDAVTTLLAAEGIDINIKSSAGSTAFMIACIKGRIELVKALLAAHQKTSNFNINNTNNNGSTALMISCMNSPVETAKLLLTIPQINTRVQNNYGQTALEHAKGKEKEDEIKALFQGELLPL